MTWLAWRQFRTPALVIAVLLVAVGVAYGVTGPGILHLYDTVVKPCKANNDCATVTSNFLAKYQTWKTVSKLLLLFPVLLGMFWGAPLVAREMETGTFRLSWTQSVTRRRWFFTRVGIAVVASMVATGLLSLMVTWWSRPFDSFINFPFNTFDQRNVVVIGYAAFAVMLGVALGALFRRTIPAMGATLAGFVAVRFLITDYVRPVLASAKTLTEKFQAFTTSHGFGAQVGAGLKQANWLISNTIVNRAGHVVLPNGNINFRNLAHARLEFVGVGECPSQYLSSSNDAMPKCVNSFHLLDVVKYQPVSRYWPFQWEEMAIYLVLAVGLGAFSYWWVRRRVV